MSEDPKKTSQFVDMTAAEVVDRTKVEVPISNLQTGAAAPLQRAMNLEQFSVVVGADFTAAAAAINESIAAVGGYTLVQKSATSGGMWGPRDGAAIMFIGSDGYLVGGWFGDIADTDWVGGITTNQVYKTSDFGVTWTRVRAHDLTPDATHFTPRHTFAHCLHRISNADYMYIFSGDTNDFDSDVRRSTDGITWNKVNTVAPGYAGTVLSGAASLNGNLYVMGGLTDLTTAAHKNIVWRSTDNGVTWTSLGAAPWSPRMIPDEVTIHKGKMFVVGGGVYDDTLGRQYFNDVWSFDGTTWTQVLANGHSQFQGRMYANVFSYDGWLYLSRGYNASGNRSDTWRSRDGVTWFSVNISLPASHADSVGVHSSGVMFGPGNGDFSNNVNANSPTRFLSARGNDLASGVEAMIDSRITVGNTFNSIILNSFINSGSSNQILIGEDASGFYVCGGNVDSNKNIYYGSSSTALHRLFGPIECNGMVKLHSLFDGTIKSEWRFEHNYADVLMSNFYPGDSTYGSWRWLGGPGSTLRMRLAGDGQLEPGAAVKLKSFTAAGLPAPSVYNTGGVVYVGNEAGGNAAVISDGAAWQRLSTRQFVYATVADMQADPLLRTGDIMRTRGYSVDGVGPNTYRFVAGDSTTANGGGVISHSAGRIWHADADPLAAVRIMQNSNGFSFFYHAGDPNSGNPLGTSINHGGLNVVRPEDFGALYAIPNCSQAQATANLNALNNAISALPDTGGTVLISGYLQTYGSIVNPKRTLNATLQSIPFCIQGTSPSAAILNYHASPAIDLSSTYTPSQVTTNAPLIVRDLLVASKGKGIKVADGGKDITLERVVIVGCDDYGLYCTNLYGASLGQVYCIYNNASGAYFGDCNHLDLRLTSRQNNGHGIVVDNVNGVRGWLYAEANEDFGIDADGLRSSQAFLWQEANSIRGKTGVDRQGQDYFQGRLRNCYDNDFAGSYAQERNTSWDADEISWRSVYPKRSDVSRYANARLSIPFPPPVGMDWIWDVPAPNAAQTASAAVVSSTIDITIPSKYYRLRSANNQWFEAFRTANYGTTYAALNNRTFAIGDTFVARGKIRADAATAAWWKQQTTSKTKWPPIKFQTANVETILTHTSQLMWPVNDGEVLEFELRDKCFAAGTGSPRLFLFLAPVNLIVPFAADSTTDIVTVAGHGLADTQEVFLSTTGTLPSPLVAGTGYFIRDATPNTFKLAATSGGAAINLTTNGTGTHYLTYDPPTSHKLIIEDLSFYHFKK